MANVQRPIRRAGIGTAVLGLILVVLGAYYVLRNTMGIELPELDSDQVVPLIAVVLGAALIYRAWRDQRPG